MTPNEASIIIRDLRQDDDRQPYAMLKRMKRLFENASPEDRKTLNGVLRRWLVSVDPSERFDAAWITDQVRLVENIDLIRKLRDVAETRDDPAAPFDWAKYNAIAGRLSAADYPTKRAGSDLPGPTSI